MLGARPVGRPTSFAKKSERCSTMPSPRVKTALLRGRRPTLAPDWIGFLAFRESFELPLGAILTPTLFLRGAPAGTNAKGRFCKARTTSAAVQLSRCRRASRMSSSGASFPFPIAPAEVG